MIEILALAYFSKKIRSIAEEQSLSAKKWLWRLILTWFGVEILTILVVIFSLGDKSTESFIFASLLGVIFSIISGFHIILKMKEE